MANENLKKAKDAKNDEFYTQYSDIQNEINAYLDYDENVFKDKTILLPCDDPEWSNFTKFFAQNFERYGIRKLISTSYARESKRKLYGYQLDLFEDADFIKNSEKYDKEHNDSRGKIFTLEKGGKKVDFNNLQWDYLKGDGDFRSDEVIALRDEADFIITNPPFSMFREFVAWINEAQKKFIIVGNKNAITYKEIFPLIKENKIWTGASSINGGRWMIMPNGIDVKSTKTKTNAQGQTIINIAGVCWFSNVEHGRRHQPLQLMSMADNIKFNKKIKDPKYPKYDNYNAIEVPSVDGIPNDYDGVMGVPITFLDKYCPEQFDILGMASSAGYNPNIVGIDFLGQKDARPLINNKNTYARVFIRHKESL